MGIEHKHAYRFGYLKSEEWKTVRVEALARDDARCQICTLRDFGSDAHHVWYPARIKDTKADDLIILCRFCHTLAHDLGFNSKEKNRELAFQEFEVFKQALKKWIGSVQSAAACREYDRSVKFKTPEKLCRCCKGTETTQRNVLEGFATNRKRMVRLCDRCFSFVRLHIDYSKPYSNETVIDVLTIIRMRGHGMDAAKLKNNPLTQPAYFSH